MAKTPMINTGDPHLDLLAAVFRQAVRDAEKGHDDARRWLQQTTAGLELKRVRLDEVFSIGDRTG